MPLPNISQPCPKICFGSGWLTFGSGKLSKSKEVTQKDVIDPRVLSSLYTSDSIRNFLIGEISFGQDGPYSQELFLNSFNGILANKVGNISSRLNGMVLKYNGGKIEKPGDMEEIDKSFIASISALKAESIQNIREFKPTLSYKAALKIIDECNAYIDNNKPWELAKDEANKARISTILYYACQGMLEAYTLLNAFLPESTAKVLAMFNVNEISIDEKACCNFNIAGLELEKTQPLFARLDINAEVKKLNELA